MQTKSGIITDIQAETYPVAGVFRISRGARRDIHIVCVTITSCCDNNVQGRGECVPYARYDETVDSVIAQIKHLAHTQPTGITRHQLQSLLPAGAARNAVDCALWDMEAKQTNRRAWEIAGIPVPENLTTAYTLSLDTPDAMHKQAQQHAHRPLLKIKLGTDRDRDRLKAVRAGAPESKLLVDANEGWNTRTYQDMLPDLCTHGVTAIEQPLPAGGDDALLNLPRPIMLIADESCHTVADYSALRGKYDAINIKLDKAGGLTEALKLKALADADHKTVMVGCMVGTSLSMAPAMMLTHGAAIVDLDAPLLLAKDRAHGLTYKGSRIPDAPARILWG